MNAKTFPSRARIPRLWTAALVAATAAVTAAAPVGGGRAERASRGAAVWRFAVSGDSR